MRAVRLAGIGVLCGLLSMPALAQRYGTLYGRVLDSSEAGISDASVTVVNEDNGFRRTTASEITGTYAVGSLDPGLYKITVRKEGFVTINRFDVKVAPASTARVDFSLPVGSMQESITVRGDPPSEDRADASTGGSFDAHDLEHLPLNGRGFLTLLELVPGTNVTPATRGEAGQFTTSGQRPNTNYFLIDGVSANTGITAGGVPAQSPGGALPPVSAFGSMDSLISVDAVDEFRVQTSTTVAEFGRLPGAIVTFTSRSGGNQFHGSSSYRLRHEVLGANNWFANQAGYDRDPERLQDFSQTLGGPLRRNRAFFFLSYQHIALRQPYVWMQPVPSQDARDGAASWVQPVLNLFPAPNGPALGDGTAQWIGRGDRPAGLHAGGLRLDQAIGRRITMFGRYNDAPSNNEFGTTGVNILNLRARSLTLGVNARVSPNLVFDTRLNESKVQAHSVWTDGTSDAPSCALYPLTSYFLGVKASCDYLVRFSIGGVGQLVSGREGDRWERQFQVVQSGSWKHGKHALSLGADYRRILAVRRDLEPALSIIADDISQVSDRFKLWISKADGVSRTTPLEELSLWAQDTWQATARLTLSLGLRWEYSPAPTASGQDSWLLDHSTGTFFQATGPLWATSLNNFAPRAGAAYRIGKEGRTVLRAGAGLYYDSSLSIATDFINGGPLSVTQFISNREGLFSTQLSYGFLPDLQLPQIVQWNVSLEHAFGAHDVGSIGYVGSAGRNLVRREAGGEGSTERSIFAVTTNHGVSDYHALQAQYKRSVARGLQAAASYTWSHSIDNDSSDAFLNWAGRGTSLANERGSSDFDLRHSFTGSVSYEFPGKGWAIDAIFRARSGFAVNVLESEQYLGIPFSNAFRPNLVAGVPGWVRDSGAPGGRRLNLAAFQSAADAVQGTLGRNAYTGLGMSQVDLALRRDWKFHERYNLQLRLEAYNAFNHPNFADPVKYLNSPLFGSSTSMLNLMLGSGSPGSGLSPILQTGGPRSLQLSVRFRF